MRKKCHVSFVKLNRSCVIYIMGISIVNIAKTPAIIDILHLFVQRILIFFDKIYICILNLNKVRRKFGSYTLATI